MFNHLLPLTDSFWRLRLLFEVAPNYGSLLCGLSFNYSFVSIYMPLLSFPPKSLHIGCFSVIKIYRTYTSSLNIGCFSLNAFDICRGVQWAVISSNFLNRSVLLLKELSVSPLWVCFITDSIRKMGIFFFVETLLLNNWFGGGEFLSSFHL